MRMEVSQPAAAGAQLGRQEQMVSERIAPVLVARSLGPFDLTVIFVAIVLFIINSAGLQAAGPSVYIFWFLAFTTFLITGAFVTAQLGRMFPEEGSLYVWTHKALGRFWGFFAGFVAWWPGPISLVFIGILVAAFLQNFASYFTCSGKPCAILTENWQLGFVVLAVILFSGALSYLRMRVTQNYVNVQFWAYAAVIFLIGFAGFVWLWKGHHSATDFSTGWNPFRTDNAGKAALGIPGNLTFFAFAILAMLGIETPMNMGVEVKGDEKQQEKAIKTYLFWGCLIVMVAYVWATWGNMVVVQSGGVPTGGATTVGLAFGKWAGAIVSLVLAWVLLTVAVVYNYSFGRLLFVSGMEKRLPHQIGRVNKNKVPANAITLQTAVASVLTIFIFFILGRGGSDYNIPFYVLYAGVTIVWCISTALLFLDIFFVKRAEPVLFERARRIPVGWLYFCGVVGTLANILAVFFIFVGPWYSGFKHLWQWNYYMIAFTAVSVLAGLLIYVISQRAIRGRSETELAAEVAREVGAAPSG
jgi:glutamate:GABA antiporter